MKKIYSREELIDLCERAVIPEVKWSNRDSASSQMQIGKALQLLKCGCQYEVLFEEGKNALCTNDETVWIEVKYDGFKTFEYGDGAGKERETFYIPTDKRLKETDGKDWY